MNAMASLPVSAPRSMPSTTPIASRMPSTTPPSAWKDDAERLNAQLDENFKQNLATGRQFPPGASEKT